MAQNLMTEIVCYISIYYCLYNYIVIVYTTKKRAKLQDFDFRIKFSQNYYYYFLFKILHCVPPKLGCAVYSLILAVL